MHHFADGETEAEFPSWEKEAQLFEEVLTAKDVPRVGITFFAYE